MDRAFTVNVNGETLFEGIKERDWRYMLERYYASGDPTRLFTASIDIDIPVPDEAQGTVGESSAKPK